MTSRLASASRRTPRSAPSAALREAGLVSVIQGRERGGRFGGTAYRLTVDADVLCRQTPELARRETVRCLPSASASRRSPSVALGQQLVLLPSA